MHLYSLCQTWLNLNLVVRGGGGAGRRVDRRSCCGRCRRCIPNANTLNRPFNDLKITRMIRLSPGTPTKLQRASQGSALGVFSTQCTHTRMHAHAHTHARTYVRTHTHTHARTRTHAAHTRTHTNTQDKHNTQARAHNSQSAKSSCTHNSAKHHPTRRGWVGARVFKDRTPAVGGRICQYAGMRAEGSEGKAHH